MTINTLKLILVDVRPLILVPEIKRKIAAAALWMLDHQENRVRKTDFENFYCRQVSDKLSVGSLVGWPDGEVDLSPDGVLFEPQLDDVV